MSILQCANIWFESTANNRVQYGGSNNFALIAAGSNSFTVNTTAVVVSPGGTTAFTINSTALVVSPGGTTLLTVNSSGSFDTAGSLRSIPINSKTATYQLASSDNGLTVSTNSSITVNGAVLTPNQSFTIYNNSSASITITQGTGATMYLAGTANTGNRTLSQRGLSTILMVASNAFVISGSGLS
jgi:hypothetical protein